MSDTVEHPNHYISALATIETLAVRKALVETLPMKKEGFLECFEAMIHSMSVEEIKGFLRGNSFKYRWRYQAKNGIEDLKKAEWYESRLLVLEETLKGLYDD